MADSLIREPLVSPPVDQPGSYRHRFRAAYVVLALAFWAAVAVLAFVVVHGGSARGAPWSTWKPPAGSRLDVAKAIAARVAPRYRLVSGAELLTVRADEPVLHVTPTQDVSIGAVAVKDESGLTSSVRALSSRNTVLYDLCGLGTRCSIAGTATVARSRLMRLEALELGLYTFKYGSGVSSVIELLPPPPGKTTKWALYLRRSSFASELARPLGETVPQGAILQPSSLSTTQGDTVERLTRQNWFTDDFQPLQNLDAIMVLSPLPATA